MMSYRDWLGHESVEAGLLRGGVIFWLAISGNLLRGRLRLIAGLPALRGQPHSHPFRPAVRDREKPDALRIDQPVSLVGERARQIAVLGHHAAKSRESYQCLTLGLGSGWPCAGTFGMRRFALHKAIATADA
jgi:hypothetical protein